MQIKRAFVIFLVAFLNCNCHLFLGLRLTRVRVRAVAERQGILLMLKSLGIIDPHIMTNFFMICSL